MKQLSLFGVVLLCGLAPASFSQAQSWSCDDLSNLPQQGMNYCAGEIYRKVDRQLNDVWKYAYRGSKGSSGETPPLLAAQRAWIGYRDSQCEAESASFEGGSIQPFIRLTCLGRITRNRTEELRRFAEDN